MKFIDVRTVIFIQFITDAVCAAVLAFLWIQNRKRFAGISLWLLDFAFQTTAVLLIALGGNIPVWMSLGFTNILVITGALIGFMGLSGFLKIRRQQIHNYILLVVLGFVHYYFAFVQPIQEVRNINLSLGLFIICFQCVWLLLYQVEHRRRKMTQWVGIVFGLFCLVSLVRIIVILVNPKPSNDFFQSGTYDALIMLSYQILLILLAFSLLMMVNQRLIGDFQTQEEKYAKAFHSSPYAITLSRLSDGKILEVNDGFMAITGYPSAEVIGKTSLDLQLWVNEADRDIIVYELSIGNRVLEREFQFRKKSGDRITGIFSAEIFMIDDLPWILSSISDITARKRAEKIQEAVYKISQSVNSTRSIDDFYQSIHSILGEIIPVDNFYIALYDPQSHLLSFPYYVDQYDERPVPYQLGRGLTEYVLRTGVPLLASPEKFAKLVRQGEVDQVGSPSIDWLGVPLRVEGQILGVMVTQSYTQGVRFDDVSTDLLAFVAEQVALAIENKRVEQKIRYLGNHDSMTDLYNRAFFDEEMTRFEHSRQFPISIVMTDVDNLKEVNDTSGHAAGDEMLRRFAQVLKASFRSEDVIARIGGDEFAILLPGILAVETKEVIKRIKDNLQKHNARKAGPLLSLSIGSSTAEIGSSLVNALILADEDMYRDKKSKE